MEAGKRVEMSDPRDGHLEVRTGKECVMEFGDVTDDGEVQLNVPGKRIWSRTYLERTPLRERQ